MRALRWIGLVGIALAMFIIFLGCEKMKAPTDPTASIQKKKNNNVTSTETHWEATKIIKYKGGGKLSIDKLFSLKVKTKSMDTGEDTEISGEADLQPDGSLLFHFEPSGLAFQPSAELTLSWHKLNLGEYETLKLHLIEPDGDRVLIATSNDDSSPYKWDKAGKIVRFDIPHFSLYALSKD